LAGYIVGVNHLASSTGSSFTLQSDTAIRIKRPFFVSPSGTRGHRIVIDMVPAPKRMVQRPNTNLIASLDNTGALPNRNPAKPRVEVAQFTGSQNPYIQRAFPQGRQMQRQPAPRRMAPQPVQSQQPRQQMPQQVPHQAPRQTMPQQHTGFLGLRNTYARGSLGLHMLTETSNEGGGGTFDAEFQPGFLLGGALGTQLDNGFRVEGEFLYTNANLKQISGTAANIVHNTEEVEGDMSSLAFMANVAYDFPNNSRLTPFVMGGVGMASLLLNDYRASSNVIADDMDWVFALQLGFGASFDLDDRTKIEVGYRYFETQDPEFSDANATPFESVYASHNFLVGARIDLN
jgi:opacity protein-like surface antigen